MSLPTLPWDCLSIIASFLDAEDLFLLINCGNSLLESNLKQVSRKLVSFRPPFEHVDDYPLALGNRLPLPSEPLKTLEKLELQFFQSGFIFEGDLSLGRWFPNLTTLSLPTLRVGVNQSHFESLPRGLRFLTLSTLVACRLPGSAIGSLPRQLESLHLMVSEIYEPVEGVFDFPLSLTSLHVGALSSFDQKNEWLPPLLQYLHISSLDECSIASSLLPAGILELSFNGFIHPFSIEMDAPLPKGLISLAGAQLKFATETPDYSLLPPSLTEIHGLPFWMTSASTVAPLLPNLKRLTLGRRDLNDLNPLPPLQSLVTFGTPSQFIPFDRLPSTLTELDARIDTLAQFNAIPTSIENLTLAESSAVVLYSAALTRLAPRLKKLQLRIKQLESLAWLKTMKLESLVLFISQSPLIQDLIIGETFPDSLTSLRLSSWSYSDDWSPVLMNLGNLSKLTSLTVTMDRTPSSMCDALHKCYPLLPRSLTYLQIPLLENLSYNAFSFLPRSLRSLKVSPLAPDSCIGNSHFSCVPPSLTFLSAVGGEINEEIYKILPPTIRSILLRVSSHSQNYHKAEVEYCSNPIWEGFNMALWKEPSKPSYFLV